MEQSTATLSNLRQAPRKVRVVADLVRGKKVAEALVHLQFTEKRASLPIRKLIESAFANAKARSIDTDLLVVKSIEVNSGKTLYRRQPAARGSAHPIRKRTSQICVTLEVTAPKVKKVKMQKEKAVENTAAKKKTVTTAVASSGRMTKKTNV